MVLDYMESWTKHKTIAIIAIVGLLLFTMCLSKWRTYDEPPVKTEINRKAVKPNRFAERLLESEGICYDLHVFIKERTENEPLSITKTQISLFKEVTEEETQEKQAKKHGVNQTLLILVMLVLLIISSIVSLADVWKVKRAQRSGNASPDSEINERCSLAEFANMKRPRRESSLNVSGYSASTYREPPPLCRFESVGTAFSRMRRDSSACPGLVVTEAPNTPPISGVKTPLKLLGARPAPMLRRSSFPASSLLDNPDNRRRLSIDSEDDSSPDTSRRRVRIIRRH